MRHLLIIALLLVACGQGPPWHPVHTRGAEVGEDVYYGDSLTHLCGDAVIGLNRSMSGYTSFDVLAQAEYHKPLDTLARYHVLIGNNDVHHGVSEGYLERMNEILALLEGEVIVTSMMPTRHATCNEQILALNPELQALVEWWGAEYRNRYPEFLGANGFVNEGYILNTTDYMNGHLNPEGCARMFGE